MPKVSSLKTGFLFCLFNVKLTNIQYRQIGLFDTGKIHSTFGETLHVRSVWLLGLIRGASKSCYVRNIYIYIN